MQNLHQSIVITGAKGTLGSAVAEHLNTEGHYVYDTWFDVTDPDVVRRHMAAANAAMYSIDTLILFAGNIKRQPAAQYNDDDWQRVLSVNLTGTFNCCKAAYPYLTKQLNKPAKVIMVSSLTAHIGIPNIAAYAAAKGGVEALCKALAVEWANDGINVNCIAPGRFVTDMSESVATDDKLDVIPMHRYGVPSDLFGVVDLLISKSANYITGQTFVVDGGWLAGGGNING